MDSTRRRILASSGALLAASLAGCTDGDDPAESTPTATPMSTPAGTPPDDETPTEEPPDGEPTTDAERLAELAAGNAAFATDLHQYLAGEAGGHVFVSPFSISVALAMTYAGARGETETQMRETLHYTLGKDVYPAFEDVQAELERRSTTTDPGEGEEVDAFQLAVANALWGREEYDFDEAYLELVDEHYAGGLRRADFAGGPEGERINEWVTDRTEDHVQDLLPPNAITARTVLILTNASYFLAAWAQEFDPEDTEDATFTALDGSESIVPMMRQHPPDRLRIARGGRGRRTALRGRGGVDGSAPPRCRVVRGVRTGP